MPQELSSAIMGTSHQLRGAPSDDSSRVLLPRGHYHEKGDVKRQDDDDAEPCLRIGLCHTVELFSLLDL